MASGEYEPPIVGALHEVQLVSGETLRVQTAVEARWFEAAKAGYLDEAKFEDRTDLQDLDRLLCLELMQFRWNQHLAAGEDYEHNLADDEQLRKNLKEQSDAINKLKDSMGLSKKARSAALEGGSVVELWTDLKRRAKAFGIHREDQLRQALVLANELSAIVATFDRSDAEERRKAGFENEAEIVAWVRDVFVPEFASIDAHFRATVQRFWAQQGTA